MCESQSFLIVGEFAVKEYLFAKFLDEDKWKTETKTEGGAIQEYLISYQNLLPTTSYNFRVIAYNKYGISLPARSADAVSQEKKCELLNALGLSCWEGRSLVSAVLLWLWDYEEKIIFRILINYLFPPSLLAIKVSKTFFYKLSSRWVALSQLEPSYSYLSLSVLALNWRETEKGFLFEKEERGRKERLFPFFLPTFSVCPSLILMCGCLVLSLLLRR